MQGRDWVNWSGSLRFTPGRVERPADEASLVRLVRQAAADGQTVRVVGAGHSCTPLMATDDTLVSLERLQGRVEHEAEAGEATVRAGMSVHDASEALFEVGLMMHNWGDVDVQTVVGAIATGTHGSGLRQPNLAWMLVGGRLVTGDGDVVAFSQEDQELLRAVRCGLGTTGIVTEARLRLKPAFRLRRTQWCMRTRDCLDQLDGLAAEADLLDFYWYPRNDLVKLRIACTSPDLPEPERARQVKDEEGWGHHVVPQRRRLRFDEMEYAMPARAGVPVFEEVREQVKARHRKEVAWRVLWRLVAPDDAFLSEAHGRETVTVSLHHNAGLPHDAYFDDLEPLFIRRRGRPHWGKKHSLDARRLRPLYPRWRDHARVRERLDPQGTFLTPYLRRLLGVAP